MGHDAPRRRSFRRLPRPARRRVGGPAGDFGDDGREHGHLLRLTDAPRLIAISLLCAAAAAAGAGAGCGGGGSGGAPTPPSLSKPVVIIGAWDFAEEDILAQLYAQALEAKGFRVRVKRKIGTSELIDRVMRRG